MRYDYRYEMYKDIEEYIERELGIAILCEMRREDAYEKIYEDLWVEDSVTGNASGSYTFNAYTAGEYLAGNWDLLLEAMEEFGCTNVNAIEKGEEWCDVTIRCYLLSEVLNEVLDELFEEEEELALYDSEYDESEDEEYGEI